MVLSDSMTLWYSRLALATPDYSRLVQDTLAFIDILHSKLAPAIPDYSMLVPDTFGFSDFTIL